MVFTSYQFVFIFLPIALLLYALAPTHQKNRLLAVISYFFYGIWDYRFCGLLFSITTLNYFIGNRIHDHAKKKVRLWLLVFSVAICVLVLGYFKYANFFTASLVAVFPQLPLSITTVLLPVGISFFTFQAISYLIDVAWTNYLVNKIIERGVLAPGIQACHFLGRLLEKGTGGELRF